VKYWRRKRDPAGHWWRWYVCSQTELDAIAVDVGYLYSFRALSVPDGRKIFFSVKYLGEIESLVRHEWAHVILWSHGIDGHGHLRSRLHAAINEIACMKLPRSLPPDLLDTE
jgi:hypothetical protein